MTVLKAIKTDGSYNKASDTVQVICGCTFCRYSKMREDVEHYKLFTRNKTGMPEYYLHIDKTNKLVEIVQKP